MLRRRYGTADSRMRAMLRPPPKSAHLGGLLRAEDELEGSVVFPAPDGPVRKTNSRPYTLS